MELSRSCHTGGRPRSSSPGVFLALVLFVLLPTGLPAAVSQAGHAPIEFVVDGHSLGFELQGISVTGSGHRLRVGFVDSLGPRPTASCVSANDCGAHLLDRVSYVGVWRGIDLTYRSNANGIVESVWSIAPYTDPQVIQLEYSQPVLIEGDGSLGIGFATGWLHESKPVAWQMNGNSYLPVEVAFHRPKRNSRSRIAFKLGTYDPSLPLFIDPVIQWHTFLGTPVSNEASGLAVDASGNTYITGKSPCSWGNPVSSCTGSSDLFVAKLDANGSLVWHTFIGSSGVESPGSIDVNASGDIFVTGSSSAEWGTPVNAHVNGYDVFVAKLNNNGVMQWHTFVGATSSDLAAAITADDLGNTYIAGKSTYSWGNPLNAHSGGNWGDVFAAMLDTNGNLVWNTFLGANDTEDNARGIALNGQGGVFVSGDSIASWGLPVKAHAGGRDPFVARLSVATGVLVWNTFLGSSSWEYGGSVAADSTGNIFFAGNSGAAWGTPLNPFAGVEDVVLAKLNTSGVLQWHTFIGSGSSDRGARIAIDATDNIYISGQSYLTWGAPFLSKPDSGSYDVFAARFDPNGTLQWNAFMGAPRTDQDYGIGVDDAGNVYALGTGENDWGSPLVSHGAGYYDSFIAQVCQDCFLVNTSAPPGQGGFTPQSQVTAAGTTASFSVNAEPGYVIDTVTGCGGTWTGSNPYVTGVVNADCTVEATYSLTSYTVSTNAPSSEGTITPGSSTTGHGSTASFTVRAEDGYRIRSVTGCGGNWSGANPYVTAPITADCTVTATFAETEDCSLYVIPTPAGGVFVPCL